VNSSSVTIKSAKLVPSRYLFILFRIGIWEGDQCAQSLLERREKRQPCFAIFFRPFLDATWSRQILPINHSADKRSDWVRDWIKAIEHFLPMLLWIILYKVVHEILKCDHLSESCRAVVLVIVLYYVILTFESVDEILKCNHLRGRACNMTSPPFTILSLY